jgi:hypothetical protein
MLTREEITYLFRVMQDDALPERASERPDQAESPGQTGQTGFTLQAASLLGAKTEPLPPKPVSKAP